MIVNDTTLTNQQQKETLLPDTLPSVQEDVATPAESPTLSQRRSLVLRAVGGVVIAATLASLPSLDSWNAHVCLGVFLWVILAQLCVPEIEGAVTVLVGLAVLAVTTALPDASGKGLWKGFGQTVTWLVTFAVILAVALTKSGLGSRLAYMLLLRLGHTNLGIAYTFTAVEMVLGAVVPSNAARGGGVLAPVVKSITEIAHHPENKLYFTLVACHANLISSSTYLTGSSGNTLLRQSAQDVLGLDYTWGMWFVAQAPSALCAVTVVPLLLYMLVQPQPLGDGEDFRQLAAEELARLGTWTRQELVLVAVLMLLLALWATEDQTGLQTAGIAMFGLAVLMVVGLLNMEDVLGAKKAWRILLYLGGMLSIVNVDSERPDWCVDSFESDLGVVQWFANAMQTVLKDLSGVPAAIVIGLLFFFSMYFFCMSDAHTTALAHACLQTAWQSGCSAKLIVSILAAFNTLCAALTHYSCATVLIYFAFGVASSARWMRIGLAVSIFYVVVWLGVGLLWWRLLGWY